MTRERAVAFIVARLDSQRLSGKQLRPIGDRLLLDWVVDRLEECDELDEIVLTTPDERVNERLVEWAGRRGIRCHLYDGGTDNVTNRLRCAAEELEADLCVLVSADCPLIFAPAIDLAVRELRATPEADIAGPHPPGSDEMSFLHGVAVARRRCWQRADDLSDTPELRANQFPVIKHRRELFELHHFEAPADHYAPRLRLSVDTWADLEFMSAVHRRLTELGREFQLRQAIELLAREPELHEINAHVRQKSYDDRPASLLVIVDADGGSGHLRLGRCLELALQIVERTSRPVTFLLDDLEALRRVESHGLRAKWGALGRAAQPAPPGLTAVDPYREAESKDLVVLDLARERNLPTGWRARFEARVAALDCTERWTTEADLVLLCGSAAHLIDSDGRSQAQHETSTRFQGGPHLAILRREVVRLRGQEHDKDIDLLVVNADERWRDAALPALERSRWSVTFADMASPELPALLARTRVFLGPLGILTNDALALGAVPVAWFDSEREREAALSFFDALHLASRLQPRSGNTARLETLLQSELPRPAFRGDKTSEVIELLTSALRPGSRVALAS